MDFIPGQQGLTVKLPILLGDLRPYALDPSCAAERRIGFYTYHADVLVEITLRHEAVEGTSRWIDLTSHRETDAQPLELLLAHEVRSRRPGRGSPEPRPDAPKKSSALVLDGVETAVDFISLGTSEICVIPAGRPNMRIALVIERSTEPEWSDKTISITQIGDLGGYTPTLTAPRR